jgi:hypothetical protein
MINNDERFIDHETDKIKNISGWMFDPKDFPPGECIYVVANQVQDIAAILKPEELKKYKYYLFIHSIHFFEQYDMPKFDVIFLKGWKRSSTYKRTDYILVNWAIKKQAKLLNYDGENGDLLDVAYTNSELRMHGGLGEVGAIQNINSHPEVLNHTARNLNW